MKTLGKAIATFAAGMALVTSNIAAAQQECITEKEFAHMLIYATPLAMDAAKSKCATTLSADGFLMSNSGEMRSKYAALQTETWPLAKSGMMKLASSNEGGQQLAAVAGLPDQALRPFIDALATQELNKGIKTKDCKNIERGMRLISPFSPRDTGALLGFLVGLIETKAVTVCKAD